MSARSYLDRIGLAAAAATMIFVSAPASAQSNANASGNLIEQLAACQAIGDPTPRLSCFDQLAATLRTAVETKEIVVLDEEDARRARRSTFGFTLPNFSKIFGKNGEGEEISQIDGVVRRSYRDPSGALVIVLEDESEWQQTTGRAPVRDPRKGQSVVVKRAALGSFFATGGS